MPTDHILKLDSCISNSIHVFPLDLRVCINMCCHYISPTHLAATARSASGQCSISSTLLS